MRAVQVDLGGRARRVGQSGHGQLATAFPDVHLPNVRGEGQDGEDGSYEHDNMCMHQNSELL